MQQRNLIALRRKAKTEGNFFVEPEAKLLFVVRIVGIIKISPKPRKVMQLLRLKQIHNGVFLKVNKPIVNMLRIIDPYVTYGYPSLKTVRDLVYKRGYGKVNKQRIPLVDNEIISANLGEQGIHGMEDLIHEVYTVGPHFKEAANFLWPFKLRPPRGGFKCKRRGSRDPRRRLGQPGGAGQRSDQEDELSALGPVTRTAAPRGHRPAAAAASS